MKLSDARLANDAMLAPPVRISGGQLSILAIIDRAPTYARKLLEEHPWLFTTGKPAADGSLVIDTKRAYTAVKRLLDRGFIEEAKDFRPPVNTSARSARRNRSKAKWYRLTRKGREVLAANRQLITKTI